MTTKLATLAEKLGFRTTATNPVRARRPETLPYNLLNINPKAIEALNRLVDLVGESEEAAKAIEDLLTATAVRVTFDRIDHTSGQPLPKIDGTQAAVWFGDLMIVQVRTTVRQTAVGPRRYTTAQITKPIVDDASKEFDRAVREQPANAWASRNQATPVAPTPAGIGGEVDSDPANEQSTGPSGW